VEGSSRSRKPKAKSRAKPKAKAPAKAKATAQAKAKASPRTQAKAKPRAKPKPKAKSKADAPTKGTAPSAGNIDELEKMEASEEAKRAEPSDVDAMGMDKRRQVIGNVGGPSRRSQFLFFGSVAAIAILLIGGWFLAVSILDQPKDEYPDKAPWSSPEAPQNSSADYTPRSPSGPCGEPGSPTPAPKGSPCAGELASDEPPLPAAPKTGPEAGGAGGISNSGGEAGGDEPGNP
jgi:hypothetical protein